MGGSICSRFAVLFSEREGMISSVTLKVQILVFVLTAPGPLIFVLLLIFWVATILHQSAWPWLPGNGKKRKVLSLANCGMGAAVGVEVIRDFVGEFVFGRR